MDGNRLARPETQRQRKRRSPLGVLGGQMVRRPSSGRAETGSQRRLTAVQPGDPLEQHLHSGSLLRSTTDRVSSGGSSARTQARALMAAIRGHPRARAIHLSGLPHHCGTTSLDDPSILIRRGCDQDRKPLQTRESEESVFCRQAESGQATMVRPPAHPERPTLRGGPVAVLSETGVARGRVWLGRPAAVRPPASSSREVSKVMIR
jgi:hypothetical protein